MRVLFHLLAVALLLLNTASAQVKIHKKLGVEDGLIQSTIRTIFKDSEGRLWFGTNLGVSCWDGMEFKNYSTANGLPGHTVFAVAEHPRGSIYFGTSNGASVLRNNTFTDLEIQGVHEPVRIKDIQVSDKGMIYFTSDTELYILEEDHLAKTTFNDQLSKVNVSSIAQDKNGKIILGTKGSGYVVADQNRLTFKTDPVTVVTGVFIRDNNDLVLSSGQTLYVVKSTGETTEIKLEKYAAVNTVAEDLNGVLFIGTDNGIVLWKDRIIDHISTANGLSNNKVYSIYRNADGSMYVGLNSGGVAVINRYRTVVFNEEIGLINNNVTSVCRGASGEYYFGTREHGVSVFRNGTFSKMSTLDELNCTQIICIAGMRNGDVYFGSNCGVVVLSNGKYSRISKENGLESNIITAIHECPDGRIVIGTVRGLSIFYKGTVKNYTRKNGLGDNLVTSITSNNKGSLFIGTFFNGVTKISKDELVVINKQQGLTSNTVYSLFANSHKLFVGTIEGLNVIREGSPALLNTSTGLSDNSINAIIGDDAGNIYAATNRGINILFPEGDKYKIKVLLSEDGISGEECNMGSVYKESSGRLWFGTIKGVVSFDPAKITPSETPPGISLRNVYMYDAELPVTAAASGFSYDQNYFRFVYFGVLLSAPRRVVYSYRLRGLNENWIRTQQNSVQFTNLDPGRYQFEVMAQNDWGVWSKPVAYAFVIEPPLWHRWWFIVLGVIILGGISSLILVRHVRSLLKVERLRLKIAAELHDNIGASLTEISIMSEVAKSKMKSDEAEAEKYLDLISGECRNLISGMKDIVWMVNPKKDTLKDLIIRLNDNFCEIFNQKGISFRAENIDLLHKITLPMDYRHNLYLILKEGINNSLKYSMCDELYLIARIKGNNLEVILKDNGIGIITRSEGYGLINMKDRAKKIGGDLLIESDNNIGTEIRFVGKIA